jgi:hypothetical protein
MSEHPYFNEIEKLLLNYKAIEFSEIKDLQFVVGLNFDSKAYNLLAKKIKENGIEGLPKTNEEKTTFGDLTVYKFLDETDAQYLVTIYDSDELWQDPEILDVFQIGK